jgi:ABC-type thiamin/hydroxymethylpyrimidine transport system permease subunit/DMSO/TMAO reductase YedYZ molybdopterin-dependent catalytic subunit
VAMVKNRYYFSTRDLLMMAVLAALGGVVSTYVNAIGDFFQSVLGFAGTTQWAAGLHVLWLVLAVAMTGKQGAGTVTGILKGGVELLSGNTHGLLVVLVDVVAGLLVDLGFLPFRDRDSLPAYCLAGGLASASNVFVFQLFASLPADVLAYGALLLVAVMAFASGVVFAGLLGRALANTLRRTGVVRDRAPVPMGRRAYPVFLAAAALLTLGLGVYLRQALRGPATVHVGGAVEAAYDYPLEHDGISQVTAEATLRDVTTRYTGVPLRELLACARPRPDASMLLIRASDGYAFFVSLEELQENESLLLVPQGEGDDASYNVVGPHNSKAWVRSVEEIVVVGSAKLEITGALERPAPYDPDDWQFEMDSAGLDLGDGQRKYQGMALGTVLQAMTPRSDATSVVLYPGGEGDPVSLAMTEVLSDDDIHIFTVIGDAGLSFAVARMDGQVIVPDVMRVDVE